MKLTCSSKAIWQVYCVVLLLALTFGSSSAWWPNQPLKKNFVRIINNLNNGETLNFRCQSKDDDLDVRSLAVNEQFEFGFRVNFWGRTLYFCNLWYLDKHAVFDAFKPTMDFKAECGGSHHCIWTAKEDGVYLLNVSTNENIMKYVWDKN